MANFGRILGDNIGELMRKEGIKPITIANKLNCSERDVWRIIEGKLLVIPEMLDKIAEILGTTPNNLLQLDSELSIPNLECMEEFSNPDNLDRILDLIDEYVELVES